MLIIVTNKHDDDEHMFLEKVFSPLVFDVLAYNCGTNLGQNASGHNVQGHY